MTTTFDQLNDHVLSEILRNLCDTRDYLSCEKVNKAFKSALSHDKLWGYIALKRELKQNLHLTPPSYDVDTSSDLVEDKYDFGNLNTWRDVACCQQVLEYIRKEQRGPEPEDEADGARPHEFVHRFDRPRDWCPVALQRDLVLDIYRNRIAADGDENRLWRSATSELILRQDSLYALLNIVSNHIVEHLKDAHRIERTPPTPNSSKSTLDSCHLISADIIRSKHENWASFREDAWEISTPRNTPVNIDVIVRKLAHRAGVLCMTEDAFDYTRTLFCNYVNALLHYSCILCLHGLDKTDLEQPCPCSSDSCEHVSAIPLEPLPNMIQDAERILHEKCSGHGKVYGIKQVAEIIEYDVKSHDSDYDSFMEMESVSSESISDDGDESLQSETDDTHFDVGEEPTQIGIELTISQDDIDVKGLNGLISSLNTHDMVKDTTTSWTTGRIRELRVRSIPQETFPALVNEMAKLLTKSPFVGSQSCYALNNLASAFAEDDAADLNGPNSLSPYMRPFLTTFLQVMDREDSDENNLRVAAFEAIVALIQNSTPDCLVLLQELLPVIVGRLQAQNSIWVLIKKDKERKEGIQGHLCGLIKVLVLKVDPQHIIPHADSIMQNILQVLQSTNPTCHQEAFSATSALCDKMEAEFEKYLSALAPFLVMGLQNFQAHHVCAIAVGLVGNIARSVEGKIQPYCNEIMTALVESLQNPDLHRSVKTSVLSSFGDIAMALKGNFEPYLKVSMIMLMQASQTPMPEDDEEIIDFINKLREGVLEAFTGIIQGMYDGERTYLIHVYVAPIMQFLQVLSAEENKDYEVLSKAAGLLGDIARAMGRNVKDQLAHPFVTALLADSYAHGNSGAQETCNWARGLIQAATQL